MEKYCLVGVDGNAYSIMGYVANAMKDAYHKNHDEAFGRAAQETYFADAKSSDYDHLLAVSMDQIDKVNDYLECI